MNLVNYYMGWNQPKEPTFLNGVNQKLDNFKTLIENYQIYENADKIAGLAFAITQIASRFWITLGGSVAGFFLGLAIDRYSAQIPPEVQEIVKKIQDIWADQGVRVSAYVVGLILLYAFPDQTSLMTSLGAGAYTFSVMTNYLPKKNQI